MNILMIYEGYARKRVGGVQIHVFTLSKALRNLGHNVFLFPIRPLHSRDNLRLSIGVLILPFLCFFGIVRMLRVVKKMNINLVHAHGARLPLILGCFIREITGSPLVVTIHEAWSRATKLNRQYKRADKIIAVSQGVKAILKNYGVDKNKLVYIPNMLDPELFNLVAVKENSDRRGLSYKLVFMGRLDPSKIGILKILLEATPRIVQKFPTTQVWIVGQRGSKFLEISRIAREINEKVGKEVVLLLGYVKDPAKILRAADIVFGVGRVAMEAMAQGKATIVGSSRGNSIVTAALVTKENADELIKYNFTGRNYTKRINAQQMAELIVNLLKDDDYRKKVKEFCKDFAVRNFGVERIVPKIESVYIRCFKQQGC